MVNDFNQMRPSLRTTLTVCLIFIVAVAAFWSMRPLRRAGGDTGEMAMLTASLGLTTYYRAPATLQAHRAVYRLLKPLGATPLDAMALNSCLAGGVFVLALLTISRHPLFLLVNIGAGAVFLFAGHEENYGYVNALLVLFLACGLRVRGIENGRATGNLNAWRWAAGVVFALGCAAHLMTVFYAPALVALAIAFRRQEGRWRLSKPLTSKAVTPFLAPGIVFLIAMTGWTLVVNQFGSVRGLDNNAMRFVPLTIGDTTPGMPDSRYFFTFFSWGHLKFMLWLQASACALALPIIACLHWRHGRDTAAQWLLVCALCGLGWTTVWHPDLLWRDWDLFANVAFPLNVLAGLLLERAWRATRDDRYVELPPSPTT